MSKLLEIVYSLILFNKHQFISTNFETSQILENIKDQTRWDFKN